jgi:hypothetical protein
MRANSDDDEADYVKTEHEQMHDMSLIVDGLVDSAKEASATHAHHAHRLSAAQAEGQLALWIQEKHNNDELREDVDEKQSIDKPDVFHKDGKGTNSPDDSDGDSNSKEILPVSPARKSICEHFGDFESLEADFIAEEKEHQCEADILVKPLTPTEKEKPDTVAVSVSEKTPGHLKTLLEESDAGVDEQASWNTDTIKDTDSKKDAIGTQHASSISTVAKTVKRDSTIIGSNQSSGKVRRASTTISRGSNAMEQQIYKIYAKNAPEELKNASPTFLADLAKKWKGKEGKLLDHLNEKFRNDLSPSVAPSVLSSAYKDESAFLTGKDRQSLRQGATGGSDDINDFDSKRKRNSS